MAGLFLNTVEAPYTLTGSKNNPHMGTSKAACKNDFHPKLHQKQVKKPCATLRTSTSTHDFVQDWEKQGDDGGDDGDGHHLVKRRVGTCRLFCARGCRQKEWTLKSWTVSGRLWMGLSSTLLFTQIPPNVNVSCPSALGTRLLCRVSDVVYSYERSKNALRTLWPRSEGVICGFHCSSPCHYQKLWYPPLRPAQASREKQLDSFKSRAYYFLSLSLLRAVVEVERRGCRREALEYSLPHLQCK